MTACWQEGTIRGGATAGGRSHLVVKIGGSLLGRPTWPAEAAALLATCQRPLVVVGGGPVVDGLRSIDAACPGPPELMHQLAIEAMKLTARLVADCLRLPLVTHAGTAGGVLAVAAWLPTAGVDLPVGWHVTSDSIAAVVAAHTERGLLLAKSVPPPHEGDDLDRLAAAGWVDPWFPRAAAGLTRIGWAAAG
jgi:aspartokinase-like uncharacterized kinase